MSFARTTAALAAAALLSACTGSPIADDLDGQAGTGVEDGSGDAGASSVRAVDVAALDGDDCTEVDPGDLEDREHHDAKEAPPASTLYEVPLPAAGPHYAQWLGPVSGVTEAPLDVRSVLHNLEHGGVAVWIDPALVSDEDVAAIDAWQRELAAVGFTTPDSGANLYASPIAPGLEVGAGIAYRAWGVGIDCEGWDAAQADAFVAEHFGTRGNAPENVLGPYPTENGVITGPPGATDSRTTSA